MVMLGVRLRGLFNAEWNSSDLVDCFNTGRRLNEKSVKTGLDEIYVA
jgi:hypothetical protein